MNCFNIAVTTFAYQQIHERFNHIIPSYIDLTIKCIFIVIKEKCFTLDLFKIKCAIPITKSSLAINDKTNHNPTRTTKLTNKRHGSDLLKIC